MDRVEVGRMTDDRRGCIARKRCLGNIFILVEGQAQLSMLVRLRFFQGAHLNIYSLRNKWSSKYTVEWPCHNGMARLIELQDNTSEFEGSKSYLRRRWRVNLKRIESLPGPAIPRISCRGGLLVC